MKTSIKFILFASIFTGFLGPGISCADGLSELQNALHRLQGTNSISAELEYISVDIKGEGDGKIHTHGQVKVLLEDDEHGLRVHYSREVLEKMEQEALLKAQDEEAETKTLNAIDGITASELYSMLSVSSSLFRVLGQAQFLQEEDTYLHGKQVRQLRFSLPIEFFISDKKIRSYVRKFKAEYLIWIGDDGTPLESRIEFSGKGRVFIFFKISVTGSASSQYQTVGDRLVVVHKQSASFNDTSLGVFEYSELKTLKIDRTH